MDVQSRCSGCCAGACWSRRRLLDVRAAHCLLLPGSLQVSYCLLAIIGFCSILVYSMVTFQERHRQRKQQKQASREFSERWKLMTASQPISRTAGFELRKRRPSQGQATGDNDTGARENHVQQGQQLGSSRVSFGQTATKDLRTNDAGVDVYHRLTVVWWSTNI